MTSNFFYFFLVVILLIVSSCGGKSSSSGGEEQREEDTSTLDIALDSDLTSTEQTSINNSLRLIKNLEINGSRIYGFSQIFGGNSSSDVANYLEKRVHYLFSKYTDMGGRLVFPSTNSSRLFATYARNSSALYWYEDVFYSGNVQFIVSGEPREITSSRFGAIQLGDIFTSSDTITQSITLVHEARHSDCPGGAWRSDIIGWNSGVYPQNKKCGQFHTSCSGNSCDGFAWGPYAIDYIYGLTILKTCTSCSETQKIQAQTNANMVYDMAFDIDGTLKGVYGSPDMSSSVNVRDDL